MHEHILPENGIKVINKLNENDLLKNFYMAGGTGLALQLGHRESIDFDFFTEKKFNTERHIINLKRNGDFQLLDEAKGTVTGIFDNIKLSFFHYDYPLLWPLKKFNNLKLATPKEIGLMKFTAIAGRGSKKDFIDLYWIAQNICPLNKLFFHFEKKYGNTYNLYHILKSLIYFQDADKDKNPKMLKPMNWEEVKEYFINNEKKLFDRYYN